MTATLFHFPADPFTVPVERPRLTANPVCPLSAVDAYWRVADVLTALEGDWLGQPVFRVHTDVAGAPGVWISVGGCRFSRTPDEARAIAHALLADQAFTGASGIAVQLLETADAADALAAPILPTPSPADLHVTGRGVLIAMAAIGLALLILTVAERL